jgi:hypothetical protein
VEGTIRSPEGDASVTVGAGVSRGGGASFGVHDKNQDGAKEICVRVETKVATVGVCAPTYEPPPVEGAEGASGQEYVDGAGGNGGWR